jgi:orotate phosphoribosyltransferase
MNSSEILNTLHQVSAIVTESHIVYTSGKHGAVYVNKDAIYPHTAATASLCEALAELFSEDQVDIVVAPALGGIILSQWVAHHLSRLNQREVLALYAEKMESTFVIKRGYDKLLPGKKILILEDVLTTGGSVRKVVKAVRALGGYVIGIGALCNRGEVTPEDLGHVPKLIALVNKKMETWNPDQCPLCTQGVPINTSVGKGREFLKKQREKEELQK